MRTVFVSRGSYRRGRQFAEELAERLGCPCVGREELIEGATAHGIPVGKLEEAIVKRRPMTEALNLVAERYKAYVTATLCQKTLDGDLVYHGRAGHIAIAGVPHVLRIRTLTDAEDRYEGVMERLHLSRDKAVTYVEGVDDDIRRWIRTLYDLDIDDPALFNVTVNCSNMTVANLATAMVSVAQLPEFQATPASIKRCENLLLAARCRLALADDPRSRTLSVQVRADDGTVSVTFLPQQATLAEAIPAVLEGVEGVTSLRQTVATSTILWVQERFDASSETLHNVLDIARRWDAAIDLVRLLPEDQSPTPAETDGEPPALAITSETGGILEDTADPEANGDDGGVRDTLHQLIQSGRAGAHCTVGGEQKSLIGSLCSVTNISLVVVDNLFLDKGEAVRKRLTRDLASRLSDRLRVPVIGAEELKTRYLFGPSQWIQLIGTLGLSALLYGVVFSHQEALLHFLRASGGNQRWMAVVVVTLMAPLVAYLWGTAAHHLLRLTRFE